MTLSFFYPDGSPMIDFEVPADQTFEIFRGEYAGYLDSEQYKWSSSWQNAADKARRFGWSDWYARCFDGVFVVQRNRVNVYLHDY